MARHWSLRLMCGSASVSYHVRCLSRCYSEGLPWEKTPYRAARVNLSKTPAESWTQQRRRDFPSLLKGDIRLGFTLHHAKGEEIVMSRWLQTDRPNKLPKYASHQVGVCGLVLREDTEEVLVTQDKYKPPVWKFPGGIAEFAEDISDAAVREVKEETGIDAEFKSIIAFRQQHRLTNYYELSDLYFICRLKPLSFDIHPCQDEIRKCQWMSLKNLAVAKDATPLSHRTAQLLMEGKRKGYETIDISMEEWPLHFPGYALTKSYKLFLRTESK